MVEGYPKNTSIKDPVIVSLFYLIPIPHTPKHMDADVYLTRYQPNKFLMKEKNEIPHFVRESEIKSSGGKMKYSPKQINWPLTGQFFGQSHLSIFRPNLQKMLSEDWKLFVINQQRGFCYHSAKTLCLPEWLSNPKIIQRHIERLNIIPDQEEFENYQIWYLAHEISHYLSGPKAKHGPIFMENLKSICPSNAIKYELGYKPRNAKAAGISKYSLSDLSL